MAIQRCRMDQGPDFSGHGRLHRSWRVLNWFTVDHRWKSTAWDKRLTDISLSIVIELPQNLWSTLNQFKTRCDPDSLVTDHTVHYKFCITLHRASQQLKETNLEERKMLSNIGSKYGGFSSTTPFSSEAEVVGVLEGDWEGGGSGGRRPCSPSLSSSLHRRQRDFTFSGFVTIGLHDSVGILYTASVLELVDVVASTEASVMLLLPDGLRFPVSDS